MARKTKYRTVSIPRGVTDLIEELIEARGLWPSVSAFAREACLEKIEEEQKRLRKPVEANPVAARVGLRSTDILLTDVGKKWFLGSYKKGIVYEYDEDEPFSLLSMGADFVEATCPLGIPYRFPIYVDGEITFQMSDQEMKPRCASRGGESSLARGRGSKEPTPRKGEDGRYRSVPTTESLAKRATRGKEVT